jgi:hypothetical protein
MFEYLDKFFAIKREREREREKMRKVSETLRKKLDMSQNYVRDDA